MPYWISRHMTQSRQLLLTQQSCWTRSDLCSRYLFCDWSCVFWSIPVHHFWWNRSVRWWFLAMLTAECSHGELNWYTLEKCTAISFLQKLSWIWFFPESLGVDILFFLCTFATNNRRYRTQRKKCGTISLSRKTKESLLALAWREIALLRSYFLHITKTGVSWKEVNR